MKVTGVRCFVSAYHGNPPVEGIFLGIVQYSTNCDRCGTDEPMAVVAHGHGMFVDLYHPSRVTLAPEDPSSEQ